MSEAAAPEIFWLALTCLITALMWIPYILVHLAEAGPVRAIATPAIDTTPKAAWAARAKKAHYNAVENLAVFAPLALAVPVVRTLAFVVGSVCQVLLALALLGVV